MNRKLAIIVPLMLSLCVVANAAGERKKKAEPAAPAPKTDTVKVKPLEVKDGLFGVGQKDKDFFFDIPDSLLGRRILAVTRYHSNAAGAGKYGGEEIDEHMVYWEKGVNGNLLLRMDVLTTTVDPKDEIAKAVAVSSENPIIASIKPEKGAPKGVTRVKANSLFEGDLQAFSFSANSKRSMGLGALNRDASFINSIRTYPINTEVTVTKTYSYSAPSGAGAMGGGSTRIPAGSQSGVVTIQTNTSFLLLPKVPMQPRLFDPRVGFFADGFTVFSDEQQGVEDCTFITRYRLEARPEDVEKQKRGELVEPIKPIVYYIDPATPKQWRQYLIDGVNDWNVAFEAAGWKNAIHAEMFPENDPDMSMEDARFCVIRYLASDIANAYGPNVHDPRSGEILESHVGWYHNVMTLVHDWYQIQAGAVDPRARSMKYSDELMGDLIRFVSSHEVGHTLGLRHNMGSSAQTPVEKLRDKEWVEANGHTVSIMDYARFNYVAQPEDNITKAGLYPRIGDYDKWAIEYGYRPTYIDDVKEDHLYWNKVIIEKLAENPRLWFGGEGRNADPRAQTEDLSDDNVKASYYGILNLKRIIGQLPEWNNEEADMYTNVQRMHSAVISQVNRYMGHVQRNIGGEYITEKSIEQPGPKYEAVPKAKQKDALKFINDNVLVKPTWIVDVPYILNITSNPEALLYPLVNGVISTSALLDITKLQRMGAWAQADAANYKPEEYLADLTGMVFSELNTGKKVDSYRRYVQRRFVSQALAALNGRNADVNDARTLLLAELNKIANKAKNASSADAVTKAHWQNIAKSIKDGLEPAPAAASTGAGMGR